MNKISKNTLLTSCTCIGLAVLLSACAAPKPGMDYDHASNAIRAAEIAGAKTYAPDEYSVAMRNYLKAEALVKDNRQERAQKLLQIAIAQADLAKAISEAEHAETAMQQLHAAN